MYCKLNIWVTTCIVVAAYMLLPVAAIGQNTFESALNKNMAALLTANPDKPTELTPNDALSGLMIPSGFGGSGINLFGGLGGIYPQVYTNKPDLAGSVGFCVGNPDKAINFAASVNITNVSEFNNFSYNFTASRRLSPGNSIAIGALQMFTQKVQTDAHASTFYFAYSHAVQSIPSKSVGASALTYTIGIGSGRFVDKSPLDMATGKGRHGTAVFGGVSYELIKHLNINAEWSGVNLGFSVGVRPLKAPLSLGVGVTNLTNYSADKTSMVFSIGFPLSLTR